MISPPGKRIDGLQFAHDMFGAIRKTYADAQIFEVPAGLEPEEFIQWGIDHDIFTVLSRVRFSRRRQDATRRRSGARGGTRKTEEEKMAHQAITIRELGAAMAYVQKAKHTQHSQVRSIDELHLALAKSEAKSQGVLSITA